MSDPLLSKMDALLHKHRGGGESAAPPPATAWLPVLTDVLVAGTPPVAVTLVPQVPRDPAPAPVTVAAPAPVVSTPVNDTLAEQLMSELAPRLSEVMEKQVAAELRKNLDQTVSTLLSQLDVNMREIVRDAVSEKLKSSPENKT